MAQPRAPFSTRSGLLIPSPPYRRQMPRRLLIALLVALALVCVPSAAAGGPFERIVGVGAHGAWRAVSLNQTGSRSDTALSGTAARVPRGGYVRICPFTGDLPAIPGRYYPGTQVLCLYWREPVSNCSRLTAAGTTLLSPFVSLALRQLPPTAPVAVRYGSRLLRYADGNIFAALELALERLPLAPSPTPPNGVKLAVTWHGPIASRLPGKLLLTATGVYTSRRLFPLQRGPWCYLAENLPDASVSLIEATARVCH
jgi:hypothetical protein